MLFWPSKNPWVHRWQDKLFSPGLISLAHQRDAEGEVITCQGCHQPGKVITNETCRQCHDPKYFVQNNPSLADSHQIFDKKDDCLRCHGEHGGSYIPLKIPGFTAQVHKSLPVKTDQCINCHRVTGKQTHPNLINDDCGSCHENYEWTSKFEHKESLAKAQTSEELLELCLECHQKGYHYTLEPQAREGCIVCHEFWGKRRKKRPIPFPEDLFKDINLDTANFDLLGKN